jgi:peptidyl-prolyl cis-trans isomerase A (cyclophilin A)
MTVIPNRTAATITKTCCAILLVVAMGLVATLSAQNEKPVEKPAAKEDTPAPVEVEKTPSTDDVEIQSAKAQAPKKFKVIFELSTGDIEIEVARKLAPLGVDQFYQAVNDGFYDECRFFRVVKGFVVQFGINGDPQVQQSWKDQPIKDDPVLFSNLKGTICFATSGPDTRTTQMFINLSDNSRLNKLGFAAFGRVNKGMKHIEAITDEYGEQPQQDKIQAEGNAYLKESFPNMDYIQRAYVVGRDAKAK